MKAAATSPLFFRRRRLLPVAAVQRLTHKRLKVELLEGALVHAPALGIDARSGKEKESWACVWNGYPVSSDSPERMRRARISGRRRERNPRRQNEPFQSGHGRSDTIFCKAGRYPA